MHKISILIVDDHDLVIMGMKQLLSAHKDITVVGAAYDGEQTLQKIAELKPDVVILDIQIPKINGIDVTKTVSEQYPDTKIILHSSFTDKEYIVQGFEVGAAGYVPKNFKPEQLLDAIHTVHSGKHYMKDFVSEIFIKDYHEQLQKSNDKNNLSKEESKVLTHREEQILKLISQGYTNQQVAEQLSISVRTVEVHKSNVMKKINVHNIAELVLYAIKHKIITV